MLKGMTFLKKCEFSSIMPVRAEVITVQISKQRKKILYCNTEQIEVKKRNSFNPKLKEMTDFDE